MIQYANNRFYAMLTTRFWGATTVLLCALLSQNCQSQLNALEEESPVAAPLQSGWQPPASEALTQSLGYPPSPPLTTATHQPQVPPAAFAGTSPSAGILPTASTTRSRNLFTQDSYRPFTVSTGALVRFEQVGSQWQAVVQGKDRSYTPQRALPVVSTGDIGTQLASLQRQDVWASRSRIHIMATSHSPYASCVYLGKSGLLGGMPTPQAPLAAVARANAERDAAVVRANEAVARANAERDAAVAWANEAVVRANAERDAAIVRANREKDEVVARANEAVARANAERAAVVRANEAVARANAERDAAVARANEAVVRANTERDAAVAWSNEAAVAWANEVVEALGARDQEIAPTSDVLAADLGTRTFGAAEWKQYFGDVGSAPDLPSDMATILNSPCPFWPGKPVKDTHLLVLIPATVGGVPFTLNLLGELVQRPSNGGHRTKYSYYHEPTKAQIGEQSPPRSYWLLMTRDVLPGSRSAGYTAQRELVAGYASRESVSYELPSVLEAATAVLMHYAREGERLFGADPWTYTRCQEMVDGYYPAVVGGFESSGLDVDAYRHYDYRSSGVSCCRKFF